MDGKYETWMDRAILEATLVTLDVPVGASLLNETGGLVGVSRNCREAHGKLLGHAESNLIIDAWEKGHFGSLEGFTLVTTLEPCLLCASIIRETGITRVVYGAANLQRGAGGSLYDILRDGRLGPPVEVIAGIRAQECERLLTDFFCQLRDESV